MKNDAPCRFLDWDSEFFGFRIAQATENRLTSSNVEQILEWCGTKGIDCLYFLADADDPATVRLAEDHHFLLVDLRVTLERTLDRVPRAELAGGDFVVRQATPEDIPALGAIARESHLDSRFFYDPGFPRYRCEALYETWIGKSCQDYADLVLVADIQGASAGYVSCHKGIQGNGRIGLMAVRREFQGRGMGRALIQEALAWFAARSIMHVSVVTQGRNASAQRFYQDSGFRTQSTRLWYHRWFTRKGMDP